MRYLKLLFQCFMNLFNPATSFFSRIEYSTVSKKAKIYHGVKLDHSVVGDYTYICHNTKVVYAKIGKYCSIAENSYIGLPSHPLTFISSSPIFISPINATGYSWTIKQVPFNEYKEVKIGNDVWIGANVLIVGGVSIGDGAVIGAGAIVTKDVAPYAIVGGIPAKIIRYRFPNDIIQRLLELKWWDKSEHILKRNMSAFQSNIIEDSILKLTENI